MFAHHLSTIAPVKSSFRRRFHAGDDSQDGKSFFCATAGQGKTTASNGLDSVISPGLVISFFFASPFHLMPLQNKMTPGSTNENLIIFFFFFSFFLLFSFSQAAPLRPVKRLCWSHWHSPPCPSFLFILIASVSGKGAYLTASFTPTPFHRALTSDLW